MNKALFALLIFPIYLAAQPASPDSLLRELSKVHTDTSRSRTYLQLALFYWNRYWNRNADSSLLMTQKAMEIAESARFDSGTAACAKMMGIIYEKNGQYTVALKFDLQGLGISERMALDALERRILNNIGLVYTDIGDYPQAIKYYHRALDAARMQPDQAHIQLGTYFINLAEAYANNKQFDSAITYNKLAIKSGEEIKDSTVLAYGLLNAGVNLIKEGRYREASDYIRQGLQIAEKRRDEERIVWANLDLADALEPLRQNDQSIHFAKTALVKAQRMHLPESEKEINHILYLNYRDKDDNKAALYYRNLEIDIGDSLFNLQKEKELRSLESDYELEKKQHQIDLLNKDKIIRENEISKEKARRYLFIAAVIFLALACLILYRSNSVKQRLNRLLNDRNREIIEQNKKLEDLNIVKNKILSIIGHDLRSPFSTLKGFIYLIQKSSLTMDRIGYFIAQMNETLMSTSHLLENILFWAKGQMEGMTVNAAQFDLEDVIMQNKKLMQARAGQKKIILIVEKSESPVIAFADETMIDIVIRNLLENAIKYSSEGGIVEMTALSSDKNFIRVAIKDYGRGIDKMDQAKILTGSVTYSTTGTLQEKGSGLGLSLCKDLVDRNGGKIWFESAPGLGTVFMFTVPNAARFDV